MRMTCCSTEENVKYEDEKVNQPIIYTYPDEFFDNADVHRSASEITRICLKYMKPN